MMVIANRREFIRHIGIGACLPATSAIADSSAQGRVRKPNVLFILTDNQRKDTIGALGNPHINKTQQFHLESATHEPRDLIEYTEKITVLVKYMRQQRPPFDDQIPLSVEQPTANQITLVYFQPHSG